jgi:hypothetical protein
MFINYKVLVILSVLFKMLSCVTHWKLSESGQIKPVDESPFTMLRPYDLVAFLEQIERLERLNIINSILSNNDLKRNENKSLKNVFSPLIGIRFLLKFRLF